VSDQVGGLEERVGMLGAIEDAVGEGKGVAWERVEKEEQKEKVEQGCGNVL